MAPSSLLLLVSLLLPSALSKTLNYDWSIGWVNRNPDGLLERPVIGINGQWPIPVINATKGDRIIANVHNHLGNESTTVHWHGLFQNGTNMMDGPGGVTQCHVLPGHSITYDFIFDQVGLYWYHSHTNGQYPDGFRQALVIQDPDSPYTGKYDEERVISVSDWYHDEIPVLMKQFVSVENPTGAEPVPNSAIMNDTNNFQFDVQPGKTYLLRFVNVGAFASQYLWIQDHSMRIVEVDGVWVDEAETDMIYIAVAQRYSVLVTMKNETDKNYPIVGSMDTGLFDTIPDGLNWNVTGHLVYDKSADLPPAKILDTFEPYNDFNLVPSDGQKVHKDPDHTVTLNLTMNNLGNGASYAFFNAKSYVYPKVPTLYTALTTGENATDVAIYGDDSQSFVLNHGDVVELVLNNFDTGRHPFHLHGHNFQVIQRSIQNAGPFDSNADSLSKQVPMRRDTLVVQPLGHFAIRYVANNPGVWFFHCHIEWHLATGLAVTLIEAPLALQKSLTIPADHLAVCKAGGVPTAGNAAANTEDLFDLSGQNREVTPLPDGFTAKGIVALVFSCVSAALGLISIGWYGMAPLGRPNK